MTDIPSNETKRDGGKWALSGFFYQTVGVAGIVARAHNLREQGLDGDDLDSLVELSGLVPESFYDQDAILIPLNGMAENQCAFYQFKYSEALSGTKLTATSFKEIIAAFVKGSRRAKSDDLAVFRYILVTNREISRTVSTWITNHRIESTELSAIVDLIVVDEQPTSPAGNRTLVENEVQAVIQLFHPPITSSGLYHFWNELTSYGERLGLSRDSISDGIRVLMANQVITATEGAGSRIDRKSLNRAFTGCEEPGELTVRAIQFKHPPDITSFFQVEMMEHLVDRNTVISKLDNLIAVGTNLIILIGYGGMGKSASLAKWVTQTLKGRPEAMIAINHARNLKKGWIASIVRGWSRIPGLLNTDDPAEAIGRLNVANQANDYKLYLILDGIDETGGDPSGDVGQLLWEFHRRNENHYIAKEVVLIATCRDEEWLNNFLEPMGIALENYLSSILVKVDQFDDDEFQALINNMKNVEARNKLREIFDESSSHLASPNFLTVGSDRNSMSLNNPFMRSSRHSTVEMELLDSLHHPVLWSVFDRLESKEQVELITRDPHGLSSFGQGIADWFTKKLNLRRCGQPLDKLDLKALVFRISQEATDLAVYDRKIWIDNALAMEWGRTNASTIFREAISSGLIETDCEVKWKWSHQLICDSFAALGAETI